jgi:hypothetical protein
VKSPVIFKDYFPELASDPAILKVVRVNKTRGKS